MPVITISTFIGSGAREIALGVAEELKIDYVDQEILVRAAGELGVPVAAVAEHDERTSKIGERLAAVMRTLMERSASAGLSDPMSGGGFESVLGRSYGEALQLPSEAPERGQMDDERYLRTLTSVIRGVAARGNVVLLGRGSQAILQHEPEALHVFVAAPRRYRAERLAERDGIAVTEAEHRLKHSDGESREFHKRYFKVDIEDAFLYDLMLQAGRVSHEMAVRLIATAARERGPRPG